MDDVLFSSWRLGIFPHIVLSQRFLSGISIGGEKRKRKKKNSVEWFNMPSKSSRQAKSQTLAHFLTHTSIDSAVCGNRNDPHPVLQDRGWKLNKGKKIVIRREKKRIKCFQFWKRSVSTLRSAWHMQKRGWGGALWGRALFLNSLKMPLSTLINKQIYYVKIIQMNIIACTKQ